MMGRSQNISYESILESISDGVFTVDLNWKVTFFNSAAERITGISRNDATGKYCSEVFRSSMCETACALRKTLRSGKPVINKECFIIDVKGREIPVSVSTAVLYDHSGRIIGGAETFRDLSEIEALRKELSAKYSSGDIITNSSCMKAVLELIPAVAASTTTLLIEGETGTGKELYARAVHNMSDRGHEPFYAINCSAFPETLLESELFGYKKGAFTGAVKDKQGWFAIAGKSTLFLDEIGELSPTIQVKLLRVLQEHSFEPVGSTKSEKTGARIIAATNKNLKELVKEGRFREDLYYRINVIKVDLPPLRKRISDVHILAMHFLDKFNIKLKKSVSGFSSNALSMLMSHGWPGNVRELENVIERAVVLSSGGRITPDLLPSEFVEAKDEKPATGKLDSVKKYAQISFIENILKENNYSVPKTAKALGVHKTTLYRIIKKYGMSRPDKIRKVL
ncbi:MAG TPA: sigma 54-interacting transcriptional regulator [bacterium]|nr:sigma 54-interacting transcriptional regulator [bacterium]HPS30639.1 sigma 54-interacting transcriptional regulator [bacterium]